MPVARLDYTYMRIVNQQSNNSQTCKIQPTCHVHHQPLTTALPKSPCLPVQCPSPGQTIVSENPLQSFHSSACWGFRFDPGHPFSPPLPRATRASARFDSVCWRMWFRSNAETFCTLVRESTAAGTKFPLFHRPCSRPSCRRRAGSVCALTRRACFCRSKSRCKSWISCRKSWAC